MSGSSRDFATSLKPNLSEPSRLNVFPGIDQEAWAQESLHAQKTLEEFFRNKNSFYHLLLAAGELRQSAQERLQKTDPNPFGVLRDERDLGDDLYSEDQFAGAENSESMAYLTKIKEIATRSGHHKVKTDYPAVEVRHEFYHDSERYRVIWPDMSHGIFVKFCAQIHANIYVKLQHPTCQGEDALKLLASLFYHLARAIPFQRGSAACAQWIVRAIAAVKGYKLENMQIEGLPADIYAHFESSESQFVDNFVKTFKTNKLNIDEKKVDEKKVDEKFIPTLPTQSSSISEQSSDPKSWLRAWLDGDYSVNNPLPEDLEKDGDEYYDDEKRAELSLVSCLRYSYQLPEYNKLLREAKSLSLEVKNLFDEKNPQKEELLKLKFQQLNALYAEIQAAKKEMHSNGTLLRTFLGLPRWPTKGASLLMLPFRLLATPVVFGVNLAALFLEAIPMYINHTGMQWIKDAKYEPGLYLFGLLARGIGSITYNIGHRFISPVIAGHDSMRFVKKAFNAGTAWQTVAAIASGIVSVGCYAATALFALPYAMATAGVTVGPGIMGVINGVAPLVSKTIAAVKAGSVAMGVFIGAATVVGSFCISKIANYLSRDKLKIEPKKIQKSSPVEQVSPQGSKAKIFRGLKITSHSSMTHSEVKTEKTSPDATIVREPATKQRLRSETKSHHSRSVGNK